MTTDYLPLFAAISAALIAGYFSFVTLINSKEQKTSEFRQNWIDSLRKEISEFTASVYFLKFYYQQGAKNTDPDFINGLKEIHNKYVSSSTAILLRINANETNKYLRAINDAFLSALSGVLDSVNASRYDEAATRCNALVEKAKPLLKEEWKRVKAGELSYKAIKYFSIAVFVGALWYAYHMSPFQAPEVAKAQSATGVGGGATEKAASSQNCTLSVSMEQSRPVKVKTAGRKTIPCSDAGEK